jgi:hypothetical protein
MTPAHAAFPGANGTIVFQNWQNANADLYVINPDGMGSRALVRATGVGAGNSSLEYPAWLADGKSLVFDNSAGIWTINANGTGLREVVTGGGTYQHPSPSPNGDQLAFAFTPAGSNRPSVQMINMNGTGRSTLAAADSTYTYSSPVWSPSGSGIAMVRGGGQWPHTLAVAAAGGTLRTYLVEHDVTSPNWSPDGRWVIYTETINFHPDIYRLDLSGPVIGSPVRLTGPNGEGFDVPEYSPDGKRILMTGQNSFEIWKANAADGSGLTQLTRTNGNADMASWAATAPADTSPPITAASVSPAPTADGWNGGPVTVTLSSTDPDGTSDVASIHYATNRGADGIVNGNRAIIPVSDAGSTRVTFYAVDRAGNLEAPQVITINIDETAPLSSAAALPGPLVPGLPVAQIDALGSISGGPTFSATCFDTRGINLSLSATDAQSGVDQIAYQLSGAQTGAGTIPGPLGIVGMTSPGVTQVSYRAVDRVGNVETPPNVVLVSVAGAGLPLSCLSSPINPSAAPPHGTLTLSGTLTLGVLTFPFNFAVRY